MIVADSDVLIDYLQGREPGRSAVTDALLRGDIATTSVSRFEVLAGTRRSEDRDRALDLLGAMPTLPLGEAEADRAGGIASALEAKGLRIGPADCLIAGIVLSRDASLLTRNGEHFGRVEGLRIEPLGG